MTDDLVGRLRKGRLIQAAESHVITIGGKTSIASTGEIRELPHPDALEAAARIEALEGALRTMIYETTHLSPGEPDGSHWCKISADALAAARQLFPKGLPHAG